MSHIANTYVSDRLFPLFRTFSTPLAIKSYYGKTTVSVVGVANIHVKNRQLEELKYQNLIADPVVYLFY